MDCSLPVSSVHGDSSGKNSGVDFHALLQGKADSGKQDQQARPWGTREDQVPKGDAVKGQ